MAAIPRVALQARFVGLRGRQPGWIDDVLGFQRLNVFFAVAVATLARRGARIRQKFGALAMYVLGEGLHNLFVALLALRSDHGPLIRLLPDRLRLGSGSGGYQEGRGKADKGYNNQ